VLDCETELHGAQRLLVACYRYVRVTWHRQVPTLTTIQEGLIVPDELGARDPDALALVHDYARRHDPSVDLSHRDATRSLLVLTRAEFCERMLWGACWRNRATLVGFNLGFDISRLRLSWHEGRGRHKGAFVLRLWEYQGGDNRFRPNVVARRLDNRRSLFSWTGVLDPPDDGAPHRSTDDHFLDLRTLSFALTNASHSLESACAAFHVDYRKRPATLGAIGPDLLDYVREDVDAATRLAEATLAEFHRHPVTLSADRAYSPAAIGAAYFRRIGIRPPRAHAEISSAQISQAMAAFYGPRVEVRIRHLPVPVSLVDFSSQYANVARLLGLWDLLAAERLVAVDATAEVRALVASSDFESVFDPDFWRGLVGVALIRASGDHMPTRAWFAGPGDVPRVGLGPLESDRLLPVSLADAVAAKLATGRAPEIISAWRVLGEGRSKRLRVAWLGSKVRFDPYSDDWWATLIDARGRLGPSLLANGLKAQGNGTAYGNWIRLDQQARPDIVTVFDRAGGEGRQTVDRPEEPFAWTFPPFAAAVTGGDRLLMALLERLLANSGGMFASANTDSATVVSCPAERLVACPGGPEKLPDGRDAIRALSWRQVDEVRESFLSLGTGLNLTPENFLDGSRHQLHAVGIAGSRVILYREIAGGRRRIVKRSEVALGDLRSPLGPGSLQTFIDQTASWMLDYILDEAAAPLSWFGKRAATEIPMGTPGRVDSLGEYGSPFGFAMGARRARRATGAFGGEPVRLLAPAGGDPATATWVEVPTGKPVPSSSAVEIATYGEELVRLVLQPEHKMLGPDGDVCRATTKGVLIPRRACVAAIHLVGKEGNRIDDVATGEVTDPDEVLTDYGDDAWEQLVLPVGRFMGIRRIARVTRLDRSQLIEVFHGRAIARPTTRALVTKEVSEWAASELGIPSPLDCAQMSAVLASFLATRARKEYEAGLANG
jgi:hypothetical protein